MVMPDCMRATANSDMLCVLGKLIDIEGTAQRLQLSFAFQTVRVSALLSIEYVIWLNRHTLTAHWAPLLTSLLLHPSKDTVLSDIR